MGSTGFERLIKFRFKLIHNTELIQLNLSQKTFQQYFHPFALVKRNVSNKLAFQRPQQQYAPQLDTENQYPLQIGAESAKQAVLAREPKDDGPKTTEAVESSGACTAQDPVLSAEE